MASLSDATLNQADQADPATLSEDEELATLSRGLGGYGKNIARRHNSVFNTLRESTLRAKQANAAIARSKSDPTYSRDERDPVAASVNVDFTRKLVPTNSTKGAKGTPGQKVRRACCCW